MMVNPDRVAFTIFGKDIYWYGILMAIGILIAVFIAEREARRKNLYKDAVIDLCLVVIPSGVIGARLYYVLFELDYYLSNPIEILYLWKGGLAIYGAVIAGLLAAFIFARVKKIRFLRLADVIAPGLVLAQAIGRWGNFFNQEAYGLPITDYAWRWFPFAVRIDGVHYFDGAICTCEFGAHLATFFYESLWCLLVFLFIWLLRKRFKHDGDAFLWYAMLYSFERMFVEGLRGDSLWLIARDTVSWLPGGIRVSQLISAIVFVCVLVFMIVRAVKEKKTGTVMWPAPEAFAAEDGAADADEDAEDAGEGAADIEESTEAEPAEDDCEQPADTDDGAADTPDDGADTDAAPENDDAGDGEKTK